MITSQESEGPAGTFVPSPEGTPWVKVARGRWRLGGEVEVLDADPAGGSVSVVLGDWFEQDGDDVLCDWVPQTVPAGLIAPGENPQVPGWRIAVPRTQWKEGADLTLDTRDGDTLTATLEGPAHDHDDDPDLVWSPFRNMSQTTGQTTGPATR